MAGKAKKTSGKAPVIKDGSVKDGSAKGSDRSKILKELGDSASGIVQKAAAILEGEIAQGIAAASRVERTVREGGEVRSDQFNDIAQRLRKDAHDMVDIISGQVNEFKAGKSDDLTKRFQSDAHDAVDLVLNLVNIAPDVIGRLQSELKSDKSSGKTKTAAAKPKK